MFRRRLLERYQLNRCIRQATNHHPAGDILTEYHQDGELTHQTDWAYMHTVPCSVLWAELGCHLYTGRQHYYLAMRIHLKIRGKNVIVMIIQNM